MKRATTKALIILKCIFNFVFPQNYFSLFSLVNPFCDIKHIQFRTDKLQIWA